MAVVGWCASSAGDMVELSVFASLDYCDGSENKIKLTEAVVNRSKMVVDWLILVHPQSKSDHCRCRVRQLMSLHLTGGRPLSQPTASTTVSVDWYPL